MKNQVTRRLIAAASTVILLWVGYLLLPYHVQFAAKHWFANADDYRIFPNDTLRTSSGTPWAVSGQVNQFQPEQQMLDLMDDRKTLAFLVVKNGEIIFEHYPQGASFSKDSISGSFSMAKSVVSLLIGRAIQDGLIASVKTPVKEILPEYSFAENEALTIEALLTMSAGFDWKEMYINPFALTTAAYYGNDLEAVLQRLKLKETPGKRWDYQSISTQVLGEILVRASGMSVSEYATNVLWKPLGMEHQALWSTDFPGGREKAFCCLSATARDFARLGQLVLQQGSWNGRQVIDTAYIRAATSPADYLSMGKDLKAIHYGYQFWIMQHKGYVVPYFCGILGQFIFVIPEENAVVVRIGAKVKEKVDEYDHYTDAYEYLEAGLQILRQYP